jgi:hypothetical protein
VTPPSRLVWTNEEGGEGGPVTTVTFEEKGGKTLGDAARKLDQYAGRKVIHLRGRYSTPIDRALICSSLLL